METVKIKSEDLDLFNSVKKNKDKSNFFKNLFLEIITNDLDVQNNFAVSELLEKIYKYNHNSKITEELLRTKLGLSKTVEFIMDYDKNEIRIGD